METREIIALSGFIKKTRVFLGDGFRAILWGVFCFVLFFKKDDSISEFYEYYNFS